MSYSRHTTAYSSQHRQRKDFYKDYFDVVDSSPDHVQHWHTMEPKRYKIRVAERTAKAMEMKLPAARERKPGLT